MKFRLNNSVMVVVLLAAVIFVLSNLDSDVETLLKSRVSNLKPAIVVNQIGYLPSWQKVAFLRHSKAAKSPYDPQDTVQLIEVNTKKAIATFPLKTKKIDSESQDRVISIDFSDIQQPGTYYLKGKRLKSVPFTIGTDIFQESIVKLLRSYYLQRCGVEIDDLITGISHPPCHIHDGTMAHSDKFHQSEDKINGVGGWHDGGSYNKYVATTTVTIGRLLSLYEQNPSLFPDSQLDIPESGNDKSDLLDEMEFGLNWLLKMQREDGAVYRKIAGNTWPVEFAPEEDIQPRYVYGISTPETAKFSAVMAIASRTFQSIDSDLANQYLTSAELAWQYLQTQPTMKVDWQEGDDGGSDKYLESESNQEASLSTDVDDRLWAAAELYITTGNKNFASYFADNLDRVEYTLFEWKNPAPLGMVNYLRQNSQPISPEIANKIKAKIIERANLVLDQVRESAYDIANDRFIWGSNKITAEEGMTLVYAYKITQNREYLNAAISQLNYLLGRNHFNQTFITDVGQNPVKNLSNLHARATGIKFPGLVVSGANATSPDGKIIPNKGPLSYADDELSYATNGNATDYNASVISLIVNLIQ